MMEKLILETVSSYSLIPKNSIVTVALSGGADSIALLYALNQLKNKLNITLNAAHLNHLIRGDEAMRDEEFVRNFCQELNIPLFCERIDVPKFAKDRSLSLETAARQVRYSYLNSVAADLIATAHTASDNLETVLLNLTRGTAVGGLCGIPVKRDNIIRPLIGCTREMIEAYCDKHRLSFVTDSSNLSDDYTRNILRHSVVPVLKKINPQVEIGVLKTSKAMKNLSDLVKIKSFDYINSNFENNKLRLENFKKLNPEIAKRIIIEFINILDAEISLEACHIDEIYRICLNGGKTGIPKNKYCINEKGYLSIGLEGEIPKTPTFSVIISQKNQKINNLLLNNSLDCGKIVGKLVIRTRQSGDSIRLLNRGCTKPLTKIYNEYSIPRELRDVLPVISDDRGVVWIHTIGVAQRCAVSNTTKNFFVIEVEKNGD